jgi:lipoate-protein ligase A
MGLVYVSRVIDPFFNLALENKLLLNVGNGKRHLLLWSNRPCVVIGRFQNPWIECNLKKMFDENIDFVRRQSGGGCVYHDENNLNLSFICSKDIHDKKLNHKFIVDTLASHSISSFATERGDVRLDEPSARKISGSASKEKKDSAFHHCTLLINSNLDNLNQYIHSSKQELDTKSIASVRSVVANLNDVQEVNQDELVDSFINGYIELYGFLGDEEIIEVTESHYLYKEIKSSSYYQKLTSNDWRYLETPKFSCHVSESLFDVDMTIKKMKIELIEIDADLVHPVLMDTFVKELIGLNLVSAKDLSVKYSLEEENKFFISFADWLDDYFDLLSLP